MDKACNGCSTAFHRRGSEMPLLRRGRASTGRTSGSPRSSSNHRSVNIFPERISEIARRFSIIPPRRSSMIPRGRLNRLKIINKPHYHRLFVRGHQGPAWHGFESGGENRSSRHATRTVWGSSLEGSIVYRSKLLVCRWHSAANLLRSAGRIC
jgi:hypothetical protein